MPENTNENAILSKLEYIGLDLEHIPDFLKETKNFDYRPLKTIEENTYKVYQYVPITKIQILLTPCNRLNTISEKYTKADSISKYLDSKSEENILKYTTFLKMLKEVNIEEIEELEEEQKWLRKQVPFLVKFHANYLWQIYYSDIADTYFMLVPTEDLDYTAFFYLLKKQIHLNKSKEEEWIYVPISHGEYSETYLKKSQIADLEKYIWNFTKDWPITYEVYDKEGNMSLQIVGKAQVYEKIQSDYKIKLQTKEETLKWYNLLKALFILGTELPHYYQFEMKVNHLGGLECQYHNKKLTYDSLMELLVTEYEKMRKQIEEQVENERKLEADLGNLKQESIKKEQEYLTKEKQIATFLECRKTFFGKVKYFLKTKKRKKDLQPNEIQDSKEKKEEPKEITKINEIKFVEKEYYTIEDMIQICKTFDDILQTIKNLNLDIEAQRRKIQSLSKKIENATLYIKEIDKHEKSIFEFWKFANKDEQILLQEASEEMTAQGQKLEKVFDYKEDFEEIGTLIDKKQRSIFTKEETDAIFIATTELLSVLNNYEKEEVFTKSLENLKNQAEQERILFHQENFDLFGNVEGDNTKIQILAGKKHRETKKDKLKILEVTKNLTLEEYQDKVLEMLKDIDEAFQKSSSPVSIPIYCASTENIETTPMQVFSINPEEAIQEQIEQKELNLYRLNIKENVPILYFTNSIYYDNHNKTLPLGMNVGTKCLIKLSDYERTLKKKENFRIVKLEDEWKIRTIKLNVYEYEIRKKEQE